MSNDIVIAKDFVLPIEAVTRRFGIMGLSGSGKSNTSAVLVEHFLAIMAQVVILDKDGTWWSLRLDANGKSKGYDIMVFGGDHGDIPLDHRSGALVADVIVDKGFSVVLDCSYMHKGEFRQFATDFAERLFFRKKSNRSPMSFILEESEEILPQRFGKDSARMVGAFEDITKRGRKYGIGSMLISQRPQSVNKEGLNQCEIIFAHYMYGSQERKAMEDWLVEKHSDVDLIEDLPYLEVGQAYVWSPRWLKTTRKVQMPLKRTFDDAKTPEFGEARIKPVALKPQDLDAIREAMSTAIQQAEENDPKALKKQIAQLRQDLARAQDAATHMPGPVILESKPVEVLVPLVSNEQLARMEKITSTLHSAMEMIQDGIVVLQEKPAELTSIVDQVQDTLRSVEKARVARKMEKVLTDNRSVIGKTISKVQRDYGKRDKSTLAELDDKHQQVLDVMAWLSSIGQDHPKHVLVASLAGRGAKSSQLERELRTLRDDGFLVWEKGHAYSLTPKGRNQAVMPDHPLGTAELQESIMRMLHPKAAEMLSVLIKAHPDSIDRVTLYETTGQGTKSSQAERLLRQLRNMGLIGWVKDELDRPAHVATDVLFL